MVNVEAFFAYIICHGRAHELVVCHNTAIFNVANAISVSEKDFGQNRARKVIFDKY